MRLVLTSAAWIGLAACTAGVPLLAQMQNNSEKQMTCSNRGFDGDRARHCEDPRAEFTRDPVCGGIT
jgi:hypothetical protein